MDKQKNSGYMMAGVGFVMLLANAFSYIFDWNMKSPAFTVLGLIFVLIGLKRARKSK
jgi:uncharacterized membrane protein